MKQPIERAKWIAKDFLQALDSHGAYDSRELAADDLAQMIYEEIWAAITEDRLSRSAPDVPVQISTTQIES